MLRSNRARPWRNGPMANSPSGPAHSVHSGIETPYVVANQRTEYHAVPLILRSGSYRGLAATANHFAREVHMDALANAAKMDSFDFRMKNLADTRMRAVLEAAAKSLGWPRK